ncbi:MAG: arylsulfatase A-like enzyme [Myxococcota bacterium]|jgi:arylsulfatase A-like enzyme
MLQDITIAGLLALTVGCSTPRERPSVVLIVVDTLRRDHLGCYGYDRATSENLDRLAAESLRFTNAQSSAPWTLPSIASILTGRDAGPLGINRDETTLGEELVLLPELLKADGYRTGAVVSQTFVSERWGVNQGFDTFDDSQVQGPSAITSPGVIDRALSFVNAQTEQQPFFLFVHLFDPHFAYIEHEGHTFSGPDYTGPVNSGTPFRELNRRHVDGDLTAADTVEMVRLYDSEISYTDAHIGRLLDGLRQTGLYDNTLIILTADHGEGFEEHEHIGHGKTLHEELIGVPLLVRVPGRRGAVVTEPVSLLDIVPTVLAQTGSKPAALLEGEDLLEPRTDRLLFASTERLGGSRVVRLGSHKLIRDRRGREVLYDLSHDPAEQTDLSTGTSAVLKPLRAGLDEYVARFPIQAAPAPTGGISPGERKRLRALGYLQEPDSP